jgi:hypothetical protein
MKYKEKLFSQGSAALNSLGLSGEYYACPICSVLFGREHLLNGELTVEHVPPKSLGGRGILLTCRDCNNRAGYSYEAAVKGRADLVKQIEGFHKNDDDVGPVKIRLGEVPLNAHLKKLGGRFDLNLQAKHNNPTAVNHFWHRVRSMSSGDRFQITLSASYDKSQARLSDLKSAFLICTANFGYTFALSSNLKFIRSQLLSGQETDYVVRYIPAPDIPENSIFADLDHKVILVRFRWKAVPLPLPTLPTNRFLELVSGARQVKLRGGFQMFPKNFIAQVDRQGENVVTISKRE